SFLYLSACVTSSHTSLCYLFYSSADPRDLHSFPTRRSSDLREILRHLEAAEAARWALEAAAAADGAATSGPGPSRVRRPRGLEGAALQLSLFDTASHPIVQELAALDVDAMTPLEALNVLARFVQRARGGER